MLDFISLHMASGLFALLDDIATLMDDVAVMSKVAAKKTAGILGDDLAVNAEDVQTSEIDLTRDARDALQQSRADNQEQASQLKHARSFREDEKQMPHSIKTWKCSAN